MSSLASFFRRPRNLVVLALGLVVVAGAATYAAAGSGKSSGGTGSHRIIVIKHATGAPVTTPKALGSGSKAAAVANVLDADVKIGEFHSDFLSYKGISSQALSQYSSAFDPSQYTVVPTKSGADFYVCSRSGRWYAEQIGVNTSPRATLSPSPLCKL
jgi:hypothetical protein